MQRRDEPAATWWRRLGREPLLVLAVIVGAALRLHQIGEQIVGDDEWHALYAAFTMGYGELFTRFGLADHCIPLALYDRLLLDTIGLTELRLRLPMLAAGLASLVVLPLVARPLVGRAASTGFAWLLAVAPLHVYHSRYARPYGIALFLAMLGTLAAWHWWSGAGRRWGWLYAACAALAPWFHLTTLPVALAPPAFLAVLGLLQRRDAAWWREALLVGSAAALGLALLLLPPVLVDLDAITAKVVAEVPLTAESWHWAATFWAGTVDEGLLLLMAALALVGAVSLGRRQPALLAYLLFMACPQVLALYVMRATFTDYAYILARYALLLMPLGLLLVALGLAALETALRRGLHRLPEGAVPAAFAALLLWAGPLGYTYVSPNNWTNHAHYQYWYQPHVRAKFERRHARQPAIGLYLKLAQLEPGSLTILEAPWHPEWSNSYALALSQRLHRQRVVMGFVAGEGQRRFGEYSAADGAIDFRNFVHVSDFEGLARRGVGLVVFHREGPHTVMYNGALAVDVEPWIRLYTERLGQPLLADERTVVFELPPE